MIARSVQTVICMREESEVFLEGAGLLGRPFRVGREPPCLLEQDRLIVANSFEGKCFYNFHYNKQSL